MDAGASAGTAFAALSPTSPLARPRMLSAGRMIRSSSRAPAPRSRPGRTRGGGPRPPWGSPRQALPGRTRRAADVVIVARDEDCPVVVPERGEDAGQLGRRIRRPIPVVAAVKGLVRAVDGHLQADDAARPEDDLRPPGLVDRAVAEDHAVGLEKVRAGRGGSPRGAASRASSSPSKSILHVDRERHVRRPSARRARPGRRRSFPCRRSRRGRRGATRPLRPRGQAIQGNDGRAVLERPGRRTGVQGSLVQRSGSTGWPS